MKINKLIYILPLAALVACEPEFDDIDFKQGSADFSTTVAVGNSLTAGFQSNGLSANGQSNSIPNIVAQQLKQVGGGEFKQPMLTGEAGDRGASIVSSLYVQSLMAPALSLVTSADCLGEVSLAPKVVGSPYSANGFNTPIGASGPYNNLGVPGAKSYHLVANGYGNAANLLNGTANPYYVRFASSSNADQSLIEAAAAQNASFFMLWIGNNDVLAYATSGGSGKNQTGNPNPASYGSNDITDPTAFAGIYNQLLDALTANGAKGVVANIPNITSIPYFTTVPIGTDAITQAQADQLNSAQAYGAYNAGLDQAVGASAITQAEADRRKITFTAGQINTFVVLDPALTDLTGINPALKSMRQATPGELLTLTTPGDSIKCAQWGTAKPIPANYHLTSFEVDSINTAIEAYNATIKSQASSRGLAFVDANARLKELASTGIIENGIAFSSAMVTGGAFSLDGVHPSTRGYAILANDFIGAINSAYGANIPKVDVGSYPTIEVTR
jgi:hypothetical protein